MTRNRRSIIEVASLAELVVRCLANPQAKGLTLLVADLRPLSTAEMVTSISDGLGRKARLIPIPQPVADLAESLPIIGRIAGQLFGTLVVDPSEMPATLGWSPVQETGKMLRVMAQAYARQPW